MPEHVNPVVPKFLPLSEIIKLRSKYSLDVFLVCRHDNSLACDRSLRRVRAFMAFAQSHKRIVPELESLIVCHGVSEVSEKRQTYTALSVAAEVH